MGARRALEAVLVQQPGHPGALNSLGLLALAEGDPRSATDCLTRAAAADPNAIPILLNLAEANRAAGDTGQELATLDRALAIDPYLLPALLRKAQAYERLGRMRESAAVYRALLAAIPSETGLPDAFRQALAHGREIVHADGEAQARRFAGPLAAVYETYKEADWSRTRVYAEQRAGLRKVYQQQPTGGHFPFLPAFEFFDRSFFPWFERLEAATDAIRAELLSLWHDGKEGFAPYVAFDPTAPVNQWAELNHSSRWSAWFLWKDGERQDAHCARCPATSAALEAVPLLDVPGKAPSVMFSVLEPHTRIPPHTGSNNIRTTVHLPLIVPPGCAFRVGGETRDWLIGQAWAFDDTIEHEAWNNSDQPRAILILDVWNPLLTEAEREAVRVLG